jgi:AcrR family transcriptional regulator
VPTESAARPARRRLLDTATRLFYADGIHAVGIDRVIAEAAVAKATFYKYFPSKDDLVHAYVQEQDFLGREAIADLPGDSPREQLLAIFDSYTNAAQAPGYRGCPFINAAAEYPDPTCLVRKAVHEHRAWLRRLLRRLLTAQHHPDPARTADILMVVADGLLVGGELDDPTRVRDLTRDTVTRVIDASP